MDAFAECEEQKERVKACYGDWFHKLWGGSFEAAHCDQETYDYRQCVQEAMSRRKAAADQEAAKARADTGWMDRAKHKTEEAAGGVAARARETREKAERLAREEAEAVKGTASQLSGKVHETADSWKGKLKDMTKSSSGKDEPKDKDRK